MKRRALRSGFVCALLLAACASNDPQPALVRVELLRGFDRTPGIERAGRVDVLFDVTQSMSQRTAKGPRKLAVARAAADRLLAALPEDTLLGLYALGTEPGACENAVSIAKAPVGWGRSEWSERIGSLPHAGEASLADALSARVPSGNTQDIPGRLVVFSDLDSGCGGDLCASASALSASGVHLDLVVIGDAEVPECLGALALLPEAIAAPALAKRAPTRFHIETERLGARVIEVSGDAGGIPVLVSPGTGTVVVELDPPLRVERSFLPGSNLVLQVIDFPALDPRVRKWRWKTVAADAAQPGASSR